MFHRGFKHSKTIKALGLRHRAFISFLVFETPMKHEARVFETVLKNSPPDLTCYVNCCVISATSFPGSLILPPPRANEGVGLCLILLQVPTGAIIGDGDRKRAPFLVLGVGPMIWDNFSIFRTNCAITCGTRAYIAARISRMSRRGNGVRNSRNRLCFWPTTQRVYGC